MPLQIRRGLAAERSTLSSPLAIGELLYVTDQGKLYIGDGTVLTDPADVQGNLGQGGKGLIITGFTSSEAKTAASEIFTEGTHNGISFVYNSGTQTIDATVDLSDYSGTIKSDAFKGTFVGDDSGILVDGVAGKIFGIVEATQLRTSESEIKLGYQDIGTNQGTFAISIGHNAGDFNQGQYAVAIGYTAGGTDQGLDAIAIGSDAGSNNQGQYAIAIGVLAGPTNQGQDSIAIGRNAGNGGTFANSIIINATGSNLTTAEPGLYIDPIKAGFGTGSILQYDLVTKEITYSSEIVGNFKGSIFNDDSTVMYDANSKVITAVGITSSSIAATTLSATGITATTVSSGTFSGTDVNVTNVSATDITASSQVTIGDVDLVWDGFTLPNVLSIGSSSYPTTLRLNTNENISYEIVGISSGPFAGGGAITFKISDGTLAVPTSVAAESVTGGITMTGFTGTGYANSGQILCYVETGTTVTPGDTFIASEIVIAPASATSMDGSNGLIVNNKGVVAANSFLNNAFANAAARDALITVPFPGQIVYIEDDGTGQPRFQGYKGAPVNAWVNLA